MSFHMHRLQNESFWDFKGKLDFVDEWFLMKSPVPMITITATYLYFVLKVGPEYMKSRKPLSLNNVIILYNIFQVFVSVYLWYLCMQLMLANGLVGKTCLLEKEHTRTGITNVMYYYFLAKISELLDTVFFVLRKKTSQVTFLHVYHHALMVVLSWSILKYEPTYLTIYIRNINSFVHMIMYTYYCLSAFPVLKKYLWWKKYITKLQLVQFLSIFVHFVMSFMTSECTPSYLACFVVVTNVSLFIFLFGKFYRETYTNKEKRRIEKDNQKFDDIKNIDKIKNNCNGEDSFKFSSNGFKSKMN